MRYTPPLKLTTRLTAFVTIIVLSAMFILFVGGTFTFKNIGQEYTSLYVRNIVTAIDKDTINDEYVQDMPRWIPKVLQASNITEIQISGPDGLVYEYSDPSPQIDTAYLYEDNFSLEKNIGYSVDIKLLPSYLEQRHSFSALSSISLAIALVIFFLLQGVNWLKKQLKGSELLEERGRMLLAGRVEEYSQGNVLEWPYTASKALDFLIEELQDARQERSRFDTFIRTHTFLDQLTGAANRVLFDSKLESALQESGASGGVILFRIFEWDKLTEAIDKPRCNEFIVEVGNIISNIVQRFPNVVFARYYESEFAILIQHQNNKDISVVANQCVKQLDKLSPLETMEKDNWYHIGATMYQEGERRGHILNELETALKSAQLQNSNAWSLFDKKGFAGDTRGTVRWRTLFDKTFANNSLLIFEQPCYLCEPDSDHTKLLHNELFARINDGDAGVLKASRFISAIEQVGYQTLMDQRVIKVVFNHIKSAAPGVCYSLNLHAFPFKQRSHVHWLRDELLQLTTNARSKLSFEFTESQLVKYLDHMRPVIRMISGLGCEVIVGQAGRSITSTHYIKDLGIDYLKLHRSLVRKINQRPENQLFIRSLIGACEGSKARVIAVGVEHVKEWNTLLELGVHGGQGRMFQAETQILPKPKVYKVQIGRRNRWGKKL